MGRKSSAFVNSQNTLLPPPKLLLIVNAYNHAAKNVPQATKHLSIKVAVRGPLSVFAFGLTAKLSTMA
jgi:hypothetical protein